MTDQKPLVTSRTAGGWSGLVSGSHLVQQISERIEVRDGCYNSGAHYGFGVDGRGPKHRFRIWTYMRECQSRKASSNGDIERPVTEGFWNAIGVYYRRLLWLISHF
jgi:hypothetical protein